MVHIGWWAGLQNAASRRSLWNRPASTRSGSSTLAPRTSSSCSQCADRSRTGGPPPARSGPQSEPHAAPSNRDPRPSSPALCRFEAKGYLLPDFYSGATGIPGRFSEGLLLRRLQAEVICYARRAARIGGAFFVYPVGGADRGGPS